MSFPTGSASVNREFQRQPHFFEATVVSAVGLLALLQWAPAVATRPLGPMLLLALLLAWGAFRLQPLARHARPGWPRWLSCRPLTAMGLPVLLLTPVAIVVAGWNQGGLSVRVVSIALLGAVVAGPPIGAAFWEDRFGRKARLARRRVHRRRRRAA